MASFFCYSALEQTTILWASSYLALSKNLPVETAASFAGLFFIGITAGRALSGFLTIKLNDGQMIRLGQLLAFIGIAVQMASAYIGTCLMPPLFGLIATHVHVALFPFYLALFLLIMILSHESLLRNGRRGA